MKMAMHKVGVTAACKTPFHTQSTVSNCYDKVNNTMYIVPICDVLASHGKQHVLCVHCFSKFLKLDL